MLEPSRQGKTRYHARDLQPGDVIRSADNQPLVVHDTPTLHPAVPDDPTQPEAVTVRWGPDGKLTSRMPADTELYRWYVADGPDAHYPVCAVCGEAWPCLHTQAVHATNRAITAEKYACAHCGNCTNGCLIIKIPTVTDRGVIKTLLFHGRKGPCRTAALRIEPDVAHRCVHCRGSTVGCRTVKVPVIAPDGQLNTLIFHARKGPCRDAADSHLAGATP